jgi:acyl-CoA dehydrogenase
MRAIGMAERALDTMLLRVTEREAFGKEISQHDTIIADIAKSRMEIDQARQLVLKAADMIDRVGAKRALKEIAMAKVIVPIMGLNVIDRAIQAHGGAGVCSDVELPKMWAAMRTLRLVDGPDAVHIAQIGRLELHRVQELRGRREKQAKSKI